MDEALQSVVVFFCLLDQRAHCLYGGLGIEKMLMFKETVIVKHTNKPTTITSRGNFNVFDQIIAH